MKSRDSTVIIEEEEETLEQSINDDQPRNIVTPSILTQTFIKISFCGFLLQGFPH